MHHIMYMSKATVAVPEEELKEMLAQWRKYNEKEDITGMLLYSGDHFVQLIEGPAENLKKLFSRINQDNHHTNIIKLADGKITHRLFADWTMGFESVAEESLAGLKGYVNPVSTQFENSLPEQEEDSPVAILKQFAQNNIKNNSY